MNNVVLIGRLTRDPEMKYTTGQNQMAVTTFTLAIDRPVRQGQEKKTDFIRVTVFGRMAENCERYLAKGRQAAGQGRIQTGSYTNKDGKTVYSTDVVAGNVEFLEYGQNGNSSQSRGSYQSQSSPQAPAQDYDVPEGFQAVSDDDIPF